MNNASEGCSLAGVCPSLILIRGRYSQLLEKRPTR